MKNQNKLFIVLCFFTSLIMGCSDVKFQPGPPPSEKNAGSDDSNGGLDSGLSGTVYETFFASSTNVGGSIDILFVVDNSTSMTLEQEKLGQRLSSFVQSLDGLDWQIGITTTDVTDGKYGLKGSLINMVGADGYILTQDTPNYEEVFKSTVVRQETISCDLVCPSSVEQPLAAAIMAVGKRSLDNAGFFRRDANLAVIMLSDEDEMSNAPSNATTPDQFVSAMSAAFGNSKKVTVFGIIIQPDDTACYDDQDTYVAYGTYVSRLAGLTGGLTGSICDEDYTKNLQNIGERVKELQNEVVLSKEPIEGSLSIQFIPHLDIKWSLEGRKVVFETDLPEGTQIDVSYEENE